MKKKPYIILAFVIVFAVFFTGCVAACGDPDNGGNTGTGGFYVSPSQTNCAVFTDSSDHMQVIRAAGDLVKDIKLVCGAELQSRSGKPENVKNAIVVGTVGKSSVIDGLIAGGKFDEAKQITGKWESYAIKVVKNAFDGVENTLVIAGSDKRGAIYGVYTVSESIGVSPWYFFADMQPTKRSKVSLDIKTTVSEEPSVKYRGIFINDEFNFTTWAKAYSDGTGAPNAEVYSHVFELLLRLKANTLWPGMHGVSTAFYKDKGDDGISLNARAADEYGVVIGTSHCEQCLRNNVGEWIDWLIANSGKYGLPDVSRYTRYSEYAALYDFSLHPEALEVYWRERLIEAKDFESLITIGMRGVHDEGFSYAGLQDKSFASRVRLLQSVIDLQLELIKEIYGEDYESKVQLVYIPYKEAANYYYGTENGVDYGVKISIPESTMLMWADDNYGYVRQTPDEDELIVTDGYGNMGVYYHLSYVGVPCVWIWTDVTSYATVYEEMKKSYDTGASGYWIVNVGDIKPIEYGMEYFLQLAYDIDKYDDTQYVDYMTARALRDFTDDKDLARDIAQLSVEFKHAAETYKSDFAGKDNMPNLSLTENGDEGLRTVNIFEKFEAEGARIYSLLPKEKKDGFFETVYYAIKAQLYSIRRTVYAQKTQLYFKQGRYLAAARYGKAAIEAQDALEADVLYYNNTLADGKWYGMMNEFIGGAYYGVITREELMRMIIPVSTAYGTNGVGAVCEGTDNYITGTEQVPGSTLTFTSLGGEMRFIDVYSLGSVNADYTLTKPDFIKAEYSGRVGAEERIVLSIDKTKVKESAEGVVKISDSFGHEYFFGVRYTAIEEDLRDNAYIMLDGAVSIEAEKYSAAENGADGSYWAVANGLGRSGSSIRAYPDTAKPSTDFISAAKVVYTVYAETAGNYSATLYRIPTLNESGQCRIAVGIGDMAPRIAEGTNATSKGSWGANVMPRIEKLNFTLSLQQGYNDVKVYRVDPSICFDKIVITANGVSDNSYYGINETYNTFGDYSYTAPARLPELGGDMPEELPSRETALFNFGEVRYLDSVYTHVSVRNGVYDEIKGFGFATLDQADGTVPYYRAEVVASERNRSFVYGTGASEFSVKLKNGTYGVAVVVGDPIAGGLSPTMTLAVGGTKLYDSYKVPAGGVNEYYARVQVTDGVLRIGLGGEWILNAVEIYPYTETAEGAGEFIVSRNGGYIEAETALERSDYAYNTVGTSNGKSWTLTAGISGDAVFTGPDCGNSNTNTATPTGASLNYKVKFDQGGTYYLWALVKAVSADDDSFHVGWDGAYQVTNNPSKRDDGFAWVYTRFNVTVGSGSTHLLTIWQREDGVAIDKFWFSPFYSEISANKSASEKMPLDHEDQVRAFKKPVVITINKVGPFGGSMGKEEKLCNRGEAFSFEMPQYLGLTADKDTIRGTAEKNAEYTVNYSTSGSDASLYDKNGTVIPIDTKVEAYDGPFDGDWQHAGDTFKNYIEGKDGISGDFSLTVLVNSKFVRTANSGEVRNNSTVRIYLTDADNTANYWLFSPAFTYRASGGDKLGCNTSAYDDVAVTESVAKEFFTDCDIYFTVSRAGSVIRWQAVVVGGEGSGHAGESYTVGCTLNNIKAQTIQIGVTNRAFAEYTFRGISLERK